jgi:hypothetical protein
MMSKINELSQSIDLSSPENFLEVLKGGFHVLNYAFITEKAQRRAEFFLADPDKDIARDVLNLPESGIARPFIDLMLPSIKFTRILYIPRHFTPITLETVGRWVEKGNFDIIKEASKLADPLPEIRNYTDELLEECLDQNLRIKVRVLSPIYIGRIMKNQPSFMDKFE